MHNVKIMKHECAFCDSAPAKVVYMGNVTEVTTYQRKPGVLPVRKIDKDHYEYLPTGEVFEYEHIENRSECGQSIRRTLANIRALVNTNVVVPQNCRWVTLTYAENMTDTERLYRDFKKFWQKFCRWCKVNEYGKPEYICVIEPQGRGAWHVHAFFIWDTVAPYIDNNAVMERLWTHGWTKTKAVANCDNVGAYFSAYLADMPLDDFQKLSQQEQEQVLQSGSVLTKDFVDEQGNVEAKRFIKGGRLHLYPANMQIVRKSRGIKNPEVEQMTLGEAKEKVSSAKLTFSRTYEIVVSDGGSVLPVGGSVADGCSCSDGVSLGVRVNIIRKEYYNSKRK